MVRELCALCHILHDGIGNEHGLAVFVRRPEYPHRAALVIFGPQGLALALGIVLDHLIGGIQDLLGAAVVLLQTDHHGARKLLFKVHDVLDVGAAELVDTLVVITHHADVAVLLRQQAHQTVLGMVGILVLIHHDIREPVLVLFQHIGVFFKQPHGQHDDVVEVHGIGALEQLLVLLIHPGAHFIAEVARLGCQHLGGIHQLILGPADLGEQTAGSEVLLIDPQGLAGLLDEPQGIIGIIDGEVGFIVHPGDLPAENAHTGRMEGGSLNILCLVPEGGFQTALELSGSLIGKGDGQNPPGLHRIDGTAVPEQVDAHLFPRQVPLQTIGVLLGEIGRHKVAVMPVSKGHHIGDPVDDHGGFSAARSGKDQHRSPGLENCLPLHGIDAGEIFLDGSPSEPGIILVEISVHIL